MFDLVRRSKMSSVKSHCARRLQTNKSDFSIDHILNVAGGKRSVKSYAETAAENKSFDWLNCTRYRPPKLPRPGKKEGIRRRQLGRNPRIPFSSSQVAFLEAKFLRTPYLSSSDVANLASHLKLSETRVKIWFQNRRARERREKEGKTKAEEVSRRTIEKMKTSAQTKQIFPFFSPKCFPLDGSDAFKYLAYVESFGYLSAVAPVDLTARQTICTIKWRESENKLSS